MSILYQKNSPMHLRLEDRDEPELYRDIFPYTRISRVKFDDTFILPRPADPMYITDTTFRDGQQARPPYTVKQIARIFDLLHKLGGKSGLIHACEFFMYSEKDRKAVEVCRSRGYRFPRVTGWIRAHLDDLKIARDMEFDEVGMLTSISDYHIYLKLGKTRRQAMADYLKLVSKALEWGIVPRCHFEDLTRADIYGFCLPFARELMHLSKEASMPVKIRLCDTMGYGVPFPGAALPRSVPRIVRTFTDEAGVPGNWMEWHGHNDFHKGLVNGVTAWLYGCGGVSSTLLGFGERTGNTPLEALVIDHISLTGNDEAADTTVISEIADYFEKELDYRIPPNYPFAGRDFNATSAGIHVDGLSKNEEIYNIFDTTALLGRTAPIIINDKSGRAGVAYWINQTFNLPPEQQFSKKHPATGLIHTRIMKAYAEGRTTSFSNKEINTLVQRFVPELFTTEFDQSKRLAGKLAAHLVQRLADELAEMPDSDSIQRHLERFRQEYPFIQYLYVTDAKGALRNAVIIDPAFRNKQDAPGFGYDYSQREWFIEPSKTGRLHITNVYQSAFTGQLILTVSTPMTNSEDEITGIIGADIQLEEILRRGESLADDAPDQEE
ncbi:MAG: histone-lysine N-methyltransferase [Deltaproteobacteria bacterium]|jgi:isopropylmalate/homocitrate/citramalate synthase|nr:histone-lysine N-methyltransferase [Deltaproteobacteria bacterium]